MELAASMTMKRLQGKVEEQKSIQIDGLEVAGEALSESASPVWTSAELNG